MRKVLLIVLMQLVVTAGVSLVFYYVQPLKARSSSAVSLKDAGPQLPACTACLRVHVNQLLVPAV